MNKSTQEKIDIMQAYLDGKPLQLRHNDGDWRLMEKKVGIDPTWQWGEMDYRIRPEPRKFLLREFDERQMLEDVTDVGTQTINNMIELHRRDDEIVTPLMEVMPHDYT